jgi:hypothetical protein
MTDRFSERRQMKILEQARALLANPPTPYTPPPPRCAERTLPRDEPFVPEYVEPARLDTSPAPAASLDRSEIAGMIDRRVKAAVAAAIATTRENLSAAAGAIAEEVVAIRESIEERVDGETKELKIQMAALSAALSDLRAMIAADAERRAETLDRLLPPPARRSDMN